MNIPKIQINEELGEMICPKCNGECQIEIELFKSVDGHIVKMFDICSKCFGAGKLDWIENILGKREKPSAIEFLENFYYPCTNIDVT